jgi:hypothetical protein
MGDRRQVHIKNINLWIYTHWGGYDLPEVVQQAIKLAEDRWMDTSYCSRIIAMHIIQENSSGSTGCGISDHSMDSEYNDIFIDTEKLTVSIGEKTWTFKEYADISELELTLREIGERE